MIRRLAKAAETFGFRAEALVVPLLDVHLANAVECFDIARSAAHDRVAFEYAYEAISHGADAIVAALGFRIGAIDRAHYKRLAFAAMAMNESGLTEHEEAARRAAAEWLSLRNELHYPSRSGTVMSRDDRDRVLADATNLLPALAATAWTVAGRAAPRTDAFVLFNLTPPGADDPRQAGDPSSGQEDGNSATIAP